MVLRASKLPTATDRVVCCLQPDCSLDSPAASAAVLEGQSWGRRRFRHVTLAAAHELGGLPGHAAARAVYHQHRPDLSVSGNVLLPPSLAC
jgi:hypothetical protein